MIDAERLRQAASVLDDLADYTSYKRSQRPQEKQRHATAALLRAVAAESYPCQCGPEWTERALHAPYCLHDSMSETYAAADALAAAILRSAE